MTTTPVHIIKKQSLNIALPDMRAALNWEANDHHVFLEMIHNQMERCFDEYGRYDEYLIIDKLDIDLGKVTYTNLDREIPGRLHTILMKTLEKYRQTAATKAEMGSAGDMQTDPRQDQLYSGNHAKVESLLFFLRNGYLPWWAQESANLVNWDEAWLQQLDTSSFKAIQQFLSKNGKDPLLRLATEFSDAFISSLLSNLDISNSTITDWEWLQKVLEITSLKEWQATTGIPAPDSSIPFSLQRLRRQYWFQWLAYATGQAPVLSLHHLLSENNDKLAFIRFWVQNRHLYDGHFSLMAAIPSVWKEELEQEIQVEAQKEGQAEKKRKLQQSTESKEEIEQSPEEKERTVAVNSIFTETKPENVTTKKSFAEHTEESLLVNDAGLILLHPFLPQLFRDNQWIVKEAFLNADTRTRAVVSMAYLVTGKTKTAEHELLLPKLLAGMAWETSLEAIEPLTDAERAGCDDLLTQVIAYWKALGNTSPGGLREGYLKRNGKLQQDSEDWRLIVEHKTQDILLSRLPWGISMIKYPWMASLLKVNWQ